jgi:hypothetical protein
LVVAPSTTYYWSVAPIVASGEVHNRAVRGSFTTAAPARDPKASDDNVRYAGVRPGAHWGGETPVAAAVSPQPLSPWFYRKRYDGIKPLAFDKVKASLPVPIIDTEPELLDAYWYCWKTWLQIWLFAPDESNHQAVANLIGCPDWGGWGSSMVLDTAFILQFARYG